MLENLVSLELLWYNVSIEEIMQSKKATSTDNQQERLKFVGWIVGFTDGEGTFSVSRIKNPTTKSGYQIFPEFVITQGAKSLFCLKKIQRYFGCGKIYINKRYDNHKEHLYRYCVRSRKDLIQYIIPFFKKNRLKTAKIKDFNRFCKIIKEMEKGNHLKRNFRILNDYTSNPSQNIGTRKK